MARFARPAEIILVAGEASGDLHAANLVKALCKLHTGVRCYGMGAGNMRAAGVEILVDSSRLAVVGITEVLTHYREIKAALRVLQEIIRTRRPDLLILIDYPDFNLRFAATAKRAGVKVLYYVSPQVWAWRPGRIKKIGQLVDMMAVVFAFEVPFYERANVPVRFVGHPLVDEARPSMMHAQAVAHFGLKLDAKIIGLFPGSRWGEINRLMPVIVESSKLLRARFPDAQFILPIAPGLDRSLVEAYLDSTAPPVVLVEDTSIYDVIQVCDAIITASGTATLQIALMATPMAIIYRVSRLSYWIARHLVTVKHIGLANIVARQRVVREFIQDDVRPQAIADEIERLLADEAYAEAMRRDMAGIRAALGEPGGSQKAAQVAVDMLQQDR
ncbi:MAG TPA: lipid-A-disaccharide synthase [Gammaproteobacteria bacterium]|nr:lipid-A-disaccharide synthase [Gammaproteobacteria bacterium]